jgi:hypothetical protein
MSFLLIVLVMCVLVEASDESDIYKAKELWDLLACVYEANANLLELLEDRRKFHAAELIVAVNVSSSQNSLFSLSRGLLHVAYVSIKMHLRRVSEEATIKFMHQEFLKEWRGLSRLTSTWTLKT